MKNAEQLKRPNKASLSTSWGGVTQFDSVKLPLTMAVIRVET